MQEERREGTTYAEDQHTTNEAVVKDKDSSGQEMTIGCIITNQEVEEEKEDGKDDIKVDGNIVDNGKTIYFH